MKNNLFQMVKLMVYRNCYEISCTLMLTFLCRDRNHPVTGGRDSHGHGTKSLASL